MELTGTITQVLPMETGTSKTGKQFSKQTFVLQYDESSQYPKVLAITLLNQNAEKSTSMLIVGKQVKVKFDATSREYNGRWYTEAIGWKVEDMMQAAYAPQQPQFAFQPQYPPQQPQYAQPQQAYASQPQMSDQGKYGNLSQDYIPF